MKRRIIEYVAVRWLNPDSRGSILCLVGPPGVGKTRSVQIVGEKGIHIYTHFYFFSLGRSIATTLGREFHRISLGGVRDEADVRGFNRTYIGSQPGRIMQGLRRAGANDPVLLLDEVDKLSKGSSVTGDPSAALLEVLDPAQNNSFVDHYINVPFDLSKVIFIATANSRSTIPEPLLDRMEVIEIPGYTVEEKTVIANRHLVPRMLKEHGLTSNDIVIPDSTLNIIAESYTLEPGVRSLERQIAAVCRHAAVKVMETRSSAKGEVPESEQVLVTATDLPAILGAPYYQGNENLVS